MHSDPVGSEQASPTVPGAFASQSLLARPTREGKIAEAAEPEHALEEREEDEHGDEPAPAVREGLPARFRTRHSPHYVDELLGDAPLRTVREIPLAEIESPSDDRAELDALEHSIRRFGIIEPLLLGRPGPPYRVIAGMRRLRAARRIGLDSVPCLVHEVDDETLADLRDAATERVTLPRPGPRETAEATGPLDPVPPVPASCQPAVAEAEIGPEFLSTLLPAMGAAGTDRFRLGVLADLAGVECSRTKTLGAALRILGSGSEIARTSVDPLTLVGGVASAVAIEARLRGVRIDISWPSGPPSGPGSGLDIVIDGARCRDVLTGLLQCLLSLAPRAGTVLGLNPQMTNIRPALVLECLLHESEPRLNPEAFLRFFDAGWSEHPCGTQAGPILAALERVARAHGGRVGVKAASNGCLVTFVLPRIEI